MGVYVVQHAFQGTSGLPEDRFVNTFHVVPATTDLTSGQLESLATATKEFFKPAASSGLSAYYSNRVLGIGRTVRIYDLADTKPRAPIYEFTDSAVPWTSQASNSIPNEVALCLSYEAPQVSGTPQARRRGRIYLGPFNTGTFSGNSYTDECRPVTAVMTAMLAAAQVYWDACAAAGAAWCVYSPSNDTGQNGGAGSAAIITSISVDNSFDTQRRRGVGPTVKTTQSIA